MKRAFANFQPDLNLRNPLVLDELVGVLDFWMDLGIDGFRVDAIGYSLGESKLFLFNCKNNLHRNLWLKWSFSKNYFEYAHDNKWKFHIDFESLGP